MSEINETVDILYSKFQFNEKPSELKNHSSKFEALDWDEYIKISQNIIKEVLRDNCFHN